MKTISFDFETYSELDLKKVGGHVYSQHVSTEIICMAYACDDAPPQLWLPGDQLPEFMQSWTFGTYQLRAWNSAFEYVIWKNVIGGEMPGLHLWTDTAALATVMAWPAQLDKCGRAMGLPQDQAKDKRGSYLIKRLCSPQGKKKLRVRDPELLEEFYEYCKQDVVAERAIGKRLLDLSPVERELWILDQEINLRGIQIDIPNIDNAIDINEQKSAELMQELREITGVENPNSQPQFLRWAREQGYTGDNLQAETLRDYIEELERE